MLKQTLSTALLGLASWLLGCTETTAPSARSGPETAHVIVCAPGSFMSGNECIQPKVECPSGTVARDGQCVAIQVAAEDPVAPPPAVVAEDGKSYDDIVDPRRARREPRARALLVTEVQGLESLFAAVPKDAADRPQLIRRLAEAYIELGAAAARDGRAAKDAETVTKSGKIERAAQMAAIKYYQMLVNQYPKFCRSGAQTTGKGSGCNDETLYFLGLEYERTNDLDKARRTFLQLIQNWPQSDWVGHTYFQFGEMFRKDAVSDPTKWVFAEQSFQEAIKYPGKIQAPAYDRLADVYEAQGKDAQAKATRAKAQAAAVAAP